jgi:hypothetical protein
MCIPCAGFLQGGEVPIAAGCTTAAACVGWAAEGTASRNALRTQTTGSSIVKKILAAAAAASLAGLAACSTAAPAPGGSTSPSAPGTSTSAATQVPPSGTSEAVAGAEASGAKAACELFNSLHADLQAAGNDANAFEDVYREAADAKGSVSGDLSGLFASIGVLALDYSSEVETGEPVDQASKDLVRDAVFANSGTCTAAGVTLRL